MRHRQHHLCLAIFSHEIFVLLLLLLMLSLLVVRASGLLMLLFMLMLMLVTAHTRYTGSPILGVSLLLAFGLVLVALLVLAIVRVVSSCVRIRRPDTVIVHARVSTSGSIGIDLAPICFHRLHLIMRHLHRCSLLHQFHRLPLLHQLPCLRCSLLLLSLTHLSLRPQHLHIPLALLRSFQSMLTSQRPTHIRRLQRQHQEKPARIHSCSHFRDVAMGLCDCDAYSAGEDGF